MCNHASTLLKSTVIPDDLTLTPDPPGLRVTFPVDTTIDPVSPSSTQCIIVTAVTDNEAEGTEALQLNIEADTAVPPNYVVTGGAFIVTITDDDST